MAIKLVTRDSGSIALKTSGMTQSQVNDLLEEQKEKIQAQYSEEINNLNAEIDGLEAETDNLEAEIARLEGVIEENVAIPVEGVEF